MVDDIVVVERKERFCSVRRQRLPILYSHPRIRASSHASCPRKRKRSLGLRGRWRMRGSLSDSDKALAAVAGWQ